MMYYNFDDDDFMELLREAMQTQAFIEAVDQNRKLVERLAQTKRDVLEDAITEAAFFGRVVVVYFYGEKYKVFPDLSRIEYWREI